jgi:hypothetical protein
VERFLADTHFRDHPPRFLVWGFAERELQGRFFQRLDFASDYYLHPDRYNFALEQQGDSALPTFFRVHWKSFQPAALKHSLPASSWLAQVSQWIWNRCRYRFFGRIHPDLVVSQADFGDGPLLFYRYHIESLALSTEERQANRVVEAIQKFDQLCRLRGMTLIVVLIPEKEQVYRDWIPANLQSADHPFPPPSLGPIAEALGQEGVLAVNLLPVFKNAMDRGQRVYWKDDTHWNPLGVDLAAAEVWRIMNQPQPQSRVSNP